MDAYPLNTTLDHPLFPKLKGLGLSRMLDTLEVRAAQAARDHLTSGESLALLLDDELEGRDQSWLRLRFQEAGQASEALAPHRQVSRPIGRAIGRGMNQDDRRAITRQPVVDVAAVDLDEAALESALCRGL